MTTETTTQQKTALWKSFVAIAQPYFFPRIRGGAWKTLLLLCMLLVLLFGVLFLIASGLTLTVHYFAPELTARIAPGLVAVVQSLLLSKSWLIAVILGVPLLVFVFFRRYLRLRRQAWILLAIVLLLSLSVTGINVAFSYVGNYFTNALVKKDQGMAYMFVAVYFCSFLVGIPIVALYGYVQDYLGMRWREWLTGEFLGNYFKNRSYYDIEAEGKIDNPDQRIMEDIRSFTRTSLGFLLIILGSLMDLVSFSGILWSKSALLVAVVLGYSIIGTGITALIGRRLVRLNFNQLRYEADFRYSLVHVRDNTESIAFYQGEKPEVDQIKGRFRNVLKNFGLLIGWQRNLSFFTTAYSYLPVVLPFLILFPQYFGGKIEYGDMVQANFAFTQVYAALSLIVSQIEPITNFAAGVQRLSVFSEAIAPDRNLPAGIRSEEADGFALHDVTLMTPDRKHTLVQNLSVAPESRGNLLLVGESGVGKSSLLRAIAGLWNQGQGVIERPPLDEIFFLPQRPYMLLGSLRQQLIYPRLDKDISDTELHEVLKTVRLEDLPERVGGFDVELDWADVLSLGEQQRLAFARLLVNRPAYAVLDEATSALDVANEANLYNCLKKLGIHYISVGHRPSIIDFHDNVLELQGQGRWRMLSIREYLQGVS
ncbi:MAG: ABC transporter ATP-binding protein/permease [Desulfuromonadales bacterium]|nr:ABC transporter ATP-binding protein/permease [Desulfuromonadales bacterium]MBN2791902.1 ABC transporter ATP-binding protein/permease [Desulfuromonadales bacterium]